MQVDECPCVGGVHIYDISPCVVEDVFVRLSCLPEYTEYRVTAVQLLFQ